MFCTDLAHIFYIFEKAVKTMSIHFSCNTNRCSVNYLCCALSNAFPYKFMPYFGRYFVILCRL